MNHRSSINNKPFRPAWQLLLRLAFVDEVEVDLSLLDKSLREAIKPYNIPSDISEKIITAYRDATLKAFKALDSLQGDRKVFLNIYISANAKNGRHSNNNWGFFRIEKTTSINAMNSNQHLVVLYLYPDG